MPQDLERQTGPKSTGPTVISICEALNHISISFCSNCKHITRAGARCRNDVWPSTQGRLIAHVGGCYSHRKATCPPQDVTNASISCYLLQTFVFSFRYCSVEVFVPFHNGPLLFPFKLHYPINCALKRKKKTVTLFRFNICLL